MFWSLTFSYALLGHINVVFSPKIFCNQDPITLNTTRANIIIDLSL